MFIYFYLFKMANMQECQHSSVDFNVDEHVKDFVVHDGMIFYLKNIDDVSYLFERLLRHVSEIHCTDISPIQAYYLIVGCTEKTYAQCIETIISIIRDTKLADTLDLSNLKYNKTQGVHRRRLYSNSLFDDKITESGKSEIMTKHGNECRSLNIDTYIKIYVEQSQPCYKTYSQHFVEMADDHTHIITHDQMELTFSDDGKNEIKTMIFKECHRWHSMHEKERFQILDRCRTIDAYSYIDCNNGRKLKNIIRQTFYKDVSQIICDYCCLLTRSNLSKLYDDSHQGCCKIKFISSLLLLWILSSNIILLKFTLTLRKKKLDAENK
jgi:hypothetical protein